jgi:RNA polymerase sigma-70 factor (ECF subfamily)
VYSVAYRLLDNAQDAEDVTQEVMLQAVRKLPTFRGESSVGTWLHRVAVNAALGYRRKRAVRARHQAGDAPEELPDGLTTGGATRRWALAPDQPALDAETHRLIEAAIARLPEKYRDVFVLADVEGMTPREVADQLGLGEAAVKSRLHRARLRMREALAPHFEEAGV